MHAELAVARVRTNELESELNGSKRVADRREIDFDLAIQSRDEALQEKERIVVELEQDRSEHKQMVGVVSKILLIVKIDRKYLNAFMLLTLTRVEFISITNEVYSLWNYAQTLLKFNELLSLLVSKVS